jgi:6-phosphofructokinase 1
MGMHAGWLALSSSLGHPDFIVIPEFPLEYNKFLEMVLRRYREKKNLIVVVAEGAKFGDGSHMSADENEKDDFGHPRFKGSADTLAKKLKEDLKKYFDTRNINAVNPSYLYRSGAPCDLDMQWGDKLGKEAIRLNSEGLGGTVVLTIQKGERGFSMAPYSLSKLMVSKISTALLIVDSMILMAIRLRRKAEGISRKLLRRFRSIIMGWRRKILSDPDIQNVQGGGCL